MHDVIELIRLAWGLGKRCEREVWTGGEDEGDRWDFPRWDGDGSPGTGNRMRGPVHGHGM